MDEISKDQMLRKLLLNEAFHDVTLEGKDKQRVSSNRAVLSARSPVIERMLYGNYSEASTPVVKVGVEGYIIHALVEYIHTDSANMLQVAIDNDETDNENALQDTLTGQEQKIRLMAAANFYHLPGLTNKVFQWFTQCFRASPPLAFATLYLSEGEGMAVPSRLKALALCVVASYASSLKEKDNEFVTLLSPSLMEEILKSQQTRVDEEDLFKILLMWTKVKENDEGKERRAIALVLVKLIQLECIIPNQLATMVTSSGLVSTERLSETYKLQALAARGAGGPPLKRHRPMLPLWTGSMLQIAFTSTTKVDTYVFLKTPSLHTHSWQWSVLVDQMEDSTWLGMSENRRRGSQCGFWGFNRYGTVMSNHRREKETRIIPSFQTGSKVTFTLHLTPNIQGSFHCKIDDEPKCVLCDDLGMEHAQGFVPALIIRNSTCVQLLKFEKV